MLGAIAGGTITLFMNQATGEEGATVQLSSAALSFIAGYSTDFLFSKIESIINIILPKDKDHRAKSSDASKSASKHVEAQTNVDPSDMAERNRTAKSQNRRRKGKPESDANISR